MTSAPPVNATGVRRQAFLRKASAPVIDSKKPALVHRWLHAQESGKGWTTFGLRDSAHLEEAWQAFESDSDSKREKQTSSESELPPPADGEESGREQKGKKKREAAKELVIDPPDPDIPLPIWRVPVAEDRLFEVDLRTLKLWPVFWKGKGSEVMRGSWFFDSAKISPCDDKVAQELESLYHSIQPWLPSYADELRSSVTIGSEAEDKLKAPLTSLKASYVIFLGPYLARIYTDDVTSRMTKTLWTAWSGAHGGGTLVARGFDNARRLLRTRENKRPAGRSARKSEHKSRESGDAKASPNAKAGPAGDTDSIVRDGTAKPSSRPSTATTEDEEQEALAAAASTETGSAEMLRSFVTKFGSWGASSSKGTVTMSGRTKFDIKEAFAEAQNRVQTEPVGGADGRTAHAESLEGMASAGLQGDDDDTSERDEQDLTAEEEAREEEEELERERLRDEEPIELVLVWHGIGQKLAEEWKSLDFTLAVSSLRALAHKRQASAPPSDVGGGGLPVLSKGRRVQFLPVLWRATLQDFEPPTLDENAKPEEHLDNHFSIDDIFSDTIPLIRQLISGILFDIPLYLSQHREEILSRVIKESNRVWKLFAQRNNRFVQNGGRTSLIAHSLGAALAVDILSKQPTRSRLMDQLPHPGAELVFDVRNLYLAGSPVALFMWLNKAQLIARKGSDHTASCAVDEALDRSGRWGCMAVERIFNVFSASDPIGTRLNSTVDATYAKSLRSVPLVRATKSILRTLPETLEPQAPSAGLFSTWGRSATPTASPAKDSAAATVQSDDAPDGAEALFGKPDGEEKKTNAAAALGKRAKSGFEEKWKEIKAERDNKKSEDRKQAQEAAEQGQVERNRAQRRMDALCELGCVDFVIPLQTSILTNQYMEFLWSHAGYWTDTAFADFLLATLFSSSDRLTQAKSVLAKEP